MSFIPFVLFLPIFLFSYYRYKKNRNLIPVLLIGLYLFGSLCTILTPAVEWYPFFNINSFTVENFIAYSLILYPYLIASFFIEPANKITKKKSYLVDHFVAWIMIVCGLYSIGYQAPYAAIALAMGSDLVRYQQNILGEYILPSDVYTTIATGISYFYIFYIAMYFRLLVVSKSGISKSLLLIGSVSYIVSGLTFGTRDVFFNYLVGYIFCYLYFKNQLSFNQISTQKFRIKFISIACIFFVALISVERFLDRADDDSLAYGTIGYFGQQPYVFSVTVEEQRNFYNGDLRFPVFKKIITGESKNVAREENFETSFGTFIKDFYAEGGWIFLLIQTFIFPILTYSIYKIQDKHSMVGDFVFNAYAIQYLSSGFFYYSLGTRAGNIYLLILSVLWIGNNMIFSLKKSLVG